MAGNSSDPIEVESQWERIRTELHLLGVHVGSLLNVLRGRADDAAHQLHEDIDTLVDNAIQQGKSIDATTTQAVQNAAASIVVQTDQVVATVDTAARS